jgi:hypothetical protein
MILEFATGGEIFQELKDSVRFKEEKAADYIY